MVFENFKMAYIFAAYFYGKIDFIQASAAKCESVQEKTRIMCVMY